jgi:methyl-accepting chemotaxis protein
MHAISLDVSKHMAELQERMARLLHTRIVELDRRASARHPVRLAARLEHDAGVTLAEVFDLSADGALLDSVIPSVARGRLTITGLPPVPVRVAGTSESGTHLQFVFETEAARQAMAEAVAAATRQRELAA